jgi:RNase H-fold protein (predicted Holliday junction resolvase)
VSKILCIDPGSKKSGIAISDGTKTVAFCHSTIASDLKFESKLVELIESEKIENILVGKNLYPSKHFNSQEWSKTYLKNIHLPIEFINEDYSSFEAENLNPKIDKDMLAAQIILQKYLDDKI